MLPVWGEHGSAKGLCGFNILIPLAVSRALSKDRAHVVGRCGFACVQIVSPLTGILNLRIDGIPATPIARDIEKGWKETDAS
jgi:hypothetical protein